MSKRRRTSSQAEEEEPPALSVEQHRVIIISCLIVVEWDIKLADFYDLRFEDRTLPEVVEQAGWLSFIRRTVYTSKNMLRKFFVLSWRRGISRSLVRKSPSVMFQSHSRRMSEQDS
ncbi:hypothetical protein CJ030_MR2G002411 [Morella rubra]|uniref:Uncharacterized protein n=1 Tax=Morella rubra TaxID=262757 RepID=A0A6A1WDB9_9ROSI|nr:hypothetical protein CJ030_MR2G002411 [Morella rubra]